MHPTDDSGISLANDGVGGADWSVYIKSIFRRFIKSITKRSDFYDDTPIHANPTATRSRGVYAGYGRASTCSER